MKNKVSGGRTMDLDGLFSDFNKSDASLCPETALAMKQLYDKALDTISALPEPENVVVWLILVEDWNFTEAAHMLGITEVQAQSLFKTGLAEVQAIMAGRRIDTPQTLDKEELATVH